MRFRPCEVSIIQFPETLDVKRARMFFREVESRMNVGRPCVVVNCAKTHQMDRFAIHMLLCCLEEAIKRDGDVKLAAVHGDARANLQAARADRLFEIYDTDADAVNSFYQPRVNRAAHARHDEQVAENAA
jgi:anti-anti-sigma regulatory factor